MPLKRVIVLRYRETLPCWYVQNGLIGAHVWDIRIKEGACKAARTSPCQISSRASASIPPCFRAEPTVRIDDFASWLDSQINFAVFVRRPAVRGIFVSRRSSESIAEKRPTRLDLQAGICPQLWSAGPKVNRKARSLP